MVDMRPLLGETRPSALGKRLQGMWGGPEFAGFLVEKNPRFCGCWSRASVIKDCPLASLIPLLGQLPGLPRWILGL